VQHIDNIDNVQLQSAFFLCGQPFFNLIQFNSVYFVKPNNTNYKFTSEGFTICAHTTSLSQDLTSDQEKLPKNRKKTFHKEKREDTFRRATEEDPSPGWTEDI